MNAKARLDKDGNSKPLTKLTRRNFPKEPICIDMTEADTYVGDTGVEIPLCDSGAFSITNADPED